jgi:hypothetical protein
LLRVESGRDALKVFRIDARANPAKMVYFPAVGDGISKVFISESVGKKKFSVIPEPTVTILVFGSIPDPTRVSVVEMLGG